MIKLKNVRPGVLIVGDAGLRLAPGCAASKRRSVCRRKARGPSPASWRASGARSMVEKGILVSEGATNRLIYRLKE